MVIMMDSASIGPCPAQCRASGVGRITDLKGHVGWKSRCISKLRKIFVSGLQKMINGLQAFGFFLENVANWRH
jgi:hypothetical protein